METHLCVCVFRRQRNTEFVCLLLAVRKLRALSGECMFEIRTQQRLNKIQGKRPALSKLL